LAVSLWMRETSESDGTVSPTDVTDTVRYFRDSYRIALVGLWNGVSVIIAVWEVAGTSSRRELHSDYSVIT